MTLLSRVIRSLAAIRDCLDRQNGYLNLPAGTARRNQLALTPTSLFRVMAAGLSLVLAPTCQVLLSCEFRAERHFDPLKCFQGER